MRRGGIRSYRVPLGWSLAWPNPGRFNWGPFDSHVAGAAAAGISVFPLIYSTPQWVGIGPATLPVDSLIQRDLWEVFLGQAVRRYGPGAAFGPPIPSFPASRSVPGRSGTRRTASGSPTPCPCRGTRGC